MNAPTISEFIVVLIAILLGITLFFGWIFLSVVYMFKHRGMKGRAVPAISVIVFVLVGLVPDSRGSNTLAQWHQAAVLLAWSIWALGLSLFFFRGEKNKTSWF